MENHPSGYQKRVSDNMSFLPFAKLIFVLFHWQLVLFPGDDALENGGNLPPKESNNLGSFDRQTKTRSPLVPPFTLFLGEGPLLRWATEKGHSYSGLSNLEGLEKSLATLAHLDRK